MASEIDKEQAEKYVFAQNVQQSTLFNGFNRYAVAVVTLLSAVLILGVGFSTTDFVTEVTGFVQATIGLAGLVFAIWATETRKNAIQNTFLTLTITLIEVAGLVNGLVILAAKVQNTNLATPFYLIPYLVFLLVFFITYVASHASSGNGGSGHTKTVSFAGFFVIFIGAFIFAKVFGTASFNALDSLSGSSLGLSILGVGALLNLILGALSALSFYRNLLVKRFDIDLSRLYDAGQYSS
ncbi:MAG: hypothetical protein LBL41_04225 [Bifidobacteriaceae bacterium]|nr:hypothetical protein [Bifidobacteriaceae bacterium]